MSDQQQPTTTNRSRFCQRKMPIDRVEAFVFNQLCLFFSFRRHTLAVQSLSPLDGVDLTRRASLNNGRRLSFQQQEISESSKSKTSLRNFYIFFVVLFLFIFIAVVYSFVRMIKSQTTWKKQRTRKNYIYINKRKRMISSIDIGLFIGVIPITTDHFLLVRKDKIDEIVHVTPFVNPDFRVRR